MQGINLKAGKFSLTLYMYPAKGRACDGRVGIPWNHLTVTSLINSGKQLSRLQNQEW